MARSRRGGRANQREQRDQLILRKRARPATGTDMARKYATAPRRRALRAGGDRLREGRVDGLPPNVEANPTGLGVHGGWMEIACGLCVSIMREQPDNGRARTRASVMLEP